MNPSKPDEKQLFDLYDRLDKIEELIEDMDALGLDSRDAAERALLELNGQIDTLEATGN